MSENTVNTQAQETVVESQVANTEVNTPENNQAVSQGMDFLKSIGLEVNTDIVEGKVLGSQVFNKQNGLIELCSNFRLQRSFFEETNSSRTSLVFNFNGSPFKGGAIYAQELESLLNYNTSTNRYEAIPQVLSMEIRLIEKKIKNDKGEWEDRSYKTACNFKFARGSRRSSAQDDAVDSIF